MKRHKYKINSFNGFTLVELVISMAIIAILSAIITSIILTVNKIDENSQFNAKSQDEIFRLKTAFDNIMIYDNEKYEFSIDTNKINVYDNDNIIFEIEFTEQTLNYGKIPYSTINFSTINGITFNFYNNILSCSISFENTNYQHKITYFIKAAKVRT